MAEKNRNYFSIYLLVIALIGAATFYGCGAASSDPTPVIQYSITGTYQEHSGAFASARAATDGRAVPGTTERIYIYSESDPSNYADIDTAKKTFIINGLKPGSHNIVFRHEPNGAYGNRYICRSESVTLTESNPVNAVKNTLKARECTVAISGRVLGADGRPLSPAPELSLWGQKVTVDATGAYTTPLMPVGCEADIIVKAVNYKDTKTPLHFNANPNFTEITAVETTLNNLPPTVSLTSSYAEYAANSAITLTAVSSDSNNDELEYIWEVESCTSPDKGNLVKYSEGKKPNTSIYYWESPIDSCLATISVKVVEKNTVNRLSAKAKLMLKIGTGHFVQNTLPQIIDTTIDPTSLYGEREYYIECIATDTDGDALRYTLTISREDGGSTGSLSKMGAIGWTWKTPGLNAPAKFTLNFEVSDPRDHKATLTKEITVGATRPNEPPVIVSRSPEAGQTPTVMSGTKITLMVSAKDPENEKLSISWSCKSGQITPISSEGGVATAEWLAPIINTAAEKQVVVTIRDPQRDSITETFNINVEPDPTKKAPTAKIALSTSTPAAYYKSTIPLYKVGEEITFTGEATDSNQNIPIPAENMKWELIYPNDSSKEIARQTNKATFRPNNIDTGNFLVRLIATDFINISGEVVEEFRINTLPTGEILVNSKPIGANGRVEPATTYKYVDGAKEYDVYQIADDITLTSKCSDEETDVATLEANTQWSFNNSTIPGKTYKVTGIAGTLNSVRMYTIDSKAERSPEAEYKFFVNSAPVFEVATSTKNGFVANDAISLNAAVKDDANGIELTWEVATCKAGESTFSAYKAFNHAQGKSTSDTKELKSTINLTLQQLFDAIGDGPLSGVKFRLTAKDRMGQSTTNEAIGFSVVQPHTVNDFVVARGAYDEAKDESFDSLPVVTAPYVFAANEPFSIKSGSDKWEGSMVWTWSDINSKGSIKKIADEFVKGNFLDGYKIESDFGLHTIRLEGKDGEYGLVASKSVEVLINSTPKIGFVSASENGVIRFDTDGDVNFTVSVEEDDPQERLGIQWIIQRLTKDASGELIVDDSAQQIDYYSHDLDGSTGNITPVTMSGAKKKNVVVKYADIPGAAALTTGYYRVSARVYDAYNAETTSSVDVLINRLPEFKPVGTDGPLVKITVPETDADGNSYADFKEQYATSPDGLPVFLITGNPNMDIELEINGFDYEMDKAGQDINDAAYSKQIVWQYIDKDNRKMTATGKKITGCFSIGLNTVNVTIRDTYYDEKNTKYNDYAIASMTASFYVWHSFSQDIWLDYLKPESYGISSSRYAAVDLFKGADNQFYLKLEDFADGIPATYVPRIEIDATANPNVKQIRGNFPTIVKYSATTSEGGETQYVVYGTPEKAIINNIVPMADGSLIAIIKHAEDTLVESGTPDLYYHYDEDLIRLENYTKKLTKNPIIHFTTAGDDSGNKMLETMVLGASAPKGDSDFVIKLTSMVYTLDKSGAYIVKNLNNVGDDKYGVGIYDSTDFFVNERNEPRYNFDNAAISLTKYSKVRYLEKLNTQSPNKLFLTDTNNNRVVCLGTDLAGATSIAVNKPIDVTSTNSKYLITLSGEGSGEDRAFKLIDVDNNKVVTEFGKFYTEAERANVNKRAGKVLEPKAMAYYTTTGSKGEVYGGIIILEKGESSASRVQIIRTNKLDILE